MNPEGDIVLHVAWDGHAVQGVEIASTRPDVGARLLSGRSPEDVAALVPRLFSVCGASQGLAARLALAAAAGRPQDAHTLADGAADLRTETVREYAYRATLDWPRALGEPESVEALRELHAALASGGPLTTEIGRGVADRVFGLAASDWLAMNTLPALDRWLERGATPAARMLATLRFGDGGFGQSVTRLLPLPAGAGEAALLAAAMETEPAFCSRPLWEGAPAETGAVARQNRDALVTDVASRFGRSALVRFVARLRELAGLVAGTVRLRAGATPLGPGRGVAWVENARGLVVHAASLADGRVARYRILAPTEWNFHPDGAIRQGLAGTRYASEADLRHRTGLLVQSLDPCVACRVELRDA